MRIRTTQSLMIFPRRGHIIVLDYVTQRAVEAPAGVMHWIQHFAGGGDIDEALKKQPEDERQSCRTTIEHLIEAGVLQAEGESHSPPVSAGDDAWKWGPLAAAYHFSTQNLTFASLDESKALSTLKREQCPAPSLDWHDRYGEASPMRLQPPDCDNALLATMQMRRSNRNPLDCPIDVEELSDCLFAGLAITGHVETPHGRVPLCMTPSGGARNPYEAFVLVQNVRGIAPGFYHYSALAHELHLVGKNIPNHPAALVAGQDWANTMPVLVFLVAVLERSMWKYEEASAYKVVLIESGHIAQNIMLAATARGLSACPTAALAHALICSHLGLTEITHTPVYAVALCRPGKYDSEITPNLALQRGSKSEVTAHHAHSAAADPH